MKTTISSKLALLAMVGGLLFPSCIGDVRELDPDLSVNPGGKGSVTFVVSTPSPGGSAAVTRAAGSRGALAGAGGNAHFPDGVPADYRNYSEGADTVAYGTMFGGWPDAEAEREAFERAVAAMRANYEKSPAAGTRSAAAGATEDIPATRAIEAGSAEDNLVEDLMILLFGDDDKYVRSIGIGKTDDDEPALTPVSGDPERWQFTIDDMTDGSYTAIFFANARDDIAAYRTSVGGEEALKAKTIADFRANLRVNHTITANRPWNADPTDVTNNENGVYRAFPMSSQPVEFSIPNTRDFSEWPIDLIRPLAKINIRVAPELTEKYWFKINNVYVHNYERQGMLIPAENWTGRNADLFDPMVINPAGDRNTGTGLSDYLTFGYSGGATEIVDDIFVFESAAINPEPPTKDNWGRDNLALVISCDFKLPSGNGLLLLQGGVTYRIDLFGNNKRVNVLRNHVYDITITDVNETGYGSISEALENPPSGLEFDIDAWDIEEPADDDMNENTYNGRYQLTADRSVVVMGPEEDATAQVRVYTDYSGGLRSTHGGGSNAFSNSSIDDPSANTTESTTLTIRTLPGKANNSGKVRWEYITLRAGSLFKGITVIQLPRTEDVVSPVAGSTTEYIGAFWRADQRGERIIPVDKTKDWSAFVLDGADWVVMDTKPSRDRNIHTENPEMYGNDEGFDRVHNVESSVGWATGAKGTGTGYFRIGLRNSHAATPDVPARYAKVIIIYDKLPILKGDVDDIPIARVLYLRQGEGADYLMRPSDPNPGGTAITSGPNGELRPLAQKYSPYNLTANAFKGAGVATPTVEIFPQVDRTRYTGTFTDYPTQAGGLFVWAYRDGVVAFNPGQAVTPPWRIEGEHFHLWDNIAHESCPPGWRRPNDGPLDRYHESMEVMSVNTNETYQSLFLTANTTFVGGNNYNSVWGHYADGWYDRRSGKVPSYSGVSIANSAAAYMGTIFYNPYSGASIFFPNAGFHDSSTGGFPRNTRGIRSYYWTSGIGDTIEDGKTQGSTMLAGGALSVLNGQPGVVPHRAYWEASNTSPIRCVKDGMRLQGVPAPPGVIGYYAEGPKIGQLTLDGSVDYKGTPVDNGKLASEHVYVAMFKWGSAVALSSHDNGLFAPRDVIHVPDNYTGTHGSGLAGLKRKMSEHYSRTNTLNADQEAAAAYADVPYRDGNDAFTDTWALEPENGLGDPCRVYFGNRDWHMPNGGTQGWNAGEFGEGENILWSSAPAGARWVYMDGTNKLPIAGAVGSNFAGGEDWSMFLPAAGHRSSYNGSMIVQGTNGDYWSSTPVDSGDGHGYNIGFKQSELSPSGGADYSYAFPVRCVKSLAD